MALELLSLPLIFNAWVTALTATILNALLLLCVRIPTEERALAAYTPTETPDLEEARP